MILTAGFFSFSETNIAFAANSYPGKTGETEDGDSSGSGGTVANDGLCGLIYVGNNSTFNMTNGSLSGGSAKNGGGIYVSSAERSTFRAEPLWAMLRRQREVKFIMTELLP